MDLDAIRAERAKWFGWKNIAPIREALSKIPEPEVVSVWLGDTVTVTLSQRYREECGETIERVARMMKPWRKGPFAIGDLTIDSEWRSDIKYNLLHKHFDISGKVVGDIGCNNGYYLFRMAAENPARLVGFDPSALYATQFSFIDMFVRSGIEYELLGVEHVEYYEEKFDTLFCLGVLYHRSDPVSTLKSLKRGLVDGGELYLDTFIIEGDDEICLVPKERYSKIPNIYFIPTVKSLENWCYRAGFESVELLAVTVTDENEQRKTDWIDTQSLSDFLDPNDRSRTVEGYPAPRRAYIRATVRK